MTISVCMIVKNEEKNLPDCVASLKGFYDELVIVDTGSTDATKKTAEDLGAKVYDFTWRDDFAAARNFAFSKATCDYIYSADADERVNQENLEQLLALKEALDPEVDMVQMWYKGQMAHESVYNFDRELRPKLFKRVRHFVWEGAVHEQVRTQALVFDSDVEINHVPSGSHTARDLQYFREMIARGETVDARLFDMYTRELCKAGTEDDFLQAEMFFKEASEDTTRTMDEVKQAFYVLARTALIKNKEEDFFKYALRDVASDASGEVCCLLGDFYLRTGDKKEAMMWYYNAAFEARALMDIRKVDVEPLTHLIDDCLNRGEKEEARVYEAELVKRRKEHAAPV